ncbi:MAG: DUF932 domain-containing protein [Acidobacteriota bacterium]
MRLPHWFGETVYTYHTTLGRVPAMLPVFQRRPLGRNRFSDVILRHTAGECEPLTVGIVSKSYVLVQHAEAIRVVSEELIRAEIDPANVPVQVELSEYGTRMALRATLPKAFALDPGDGHTMALTFECVNSVDRTVPLFAAVGWFRFICANGLILGTTCASVRQRHSPSLRIEQFSEVLADGMHTATGDREQFLEWMSHPITDDHLVAWAGGPVAAKWGPLAAARVYGIASTGFDGKPSVKKVPPHEQTLTARHRVPGTPTRCVDAYAAAQVLAWVAARRTDVAQRLQWRSDIRDLIDALTAKSPSQALRAAS